MDDVEQLIRAFTSRGASGSTAAKLDILMDLEPIRDTRVLSFLLQVLADPEQPADVRIHVLKRLRNGGLTADERRTVAAAFGELVLHGCTVEIRLQAILALGEFTDICGVLDALGSLALEPHELLDLRYSAFTSLERAGPTADCVNLLRRLSNDEILGRAAHSALARWHLHPPD